MRLAHLGSKGIPSKGGTERVVEALASRQARTHDVTVYGSSRVCRTGVVMGVRSVALPTTGGKYGGPVFLQLSAAVRALCRRDGYDVVHLHGSENGFVAPFLRLRYPVVTTSHGPAYEREKWPWPARALMRLVEGLSVRSASRATAVARNQAELLGRRYHREVHYIPNGVDPLPIDRAAARAVLERLRFSEGEYVLFSAARVDPTKGCHTLLEALAKMDDPPPTLVVGDLHHARGYEGRLRALADTPSLAGKVVFLPRTDSPGLLGALVEGARLFVFPSTVEAMSIMLLEVLASGVPALVSDIPENRSVLPAGTRLFRAGDSSDLREKLTMLLTAERDDERSSATALAGEVRERFDWDGIARQYEAVYERVRRRT